MNSPPRPVLRAFAHGVGAIGVIGFAMAMMTAWPDLTTTIGALFLVGGIGLAAWATMSRTVPSPRIAANDNAPVPTSRPHWVFLDAAMDERLTLPK